MNSTRRDIVLVGGGHSHVAVLADWARKGCPARHATLITPEPMLRYSGMVPGWISGEHGREDGLVDLSKLAKAAGIDLVLDRCVAMDPNARSVLTQENGLIGFEYASIDVGGVGQAARILGDDPLLIDVRPIGAFVDRMAGELAQARVRPLNIVVIGGGAGGAELAFALRNAHGNTHHIQNPPNISFVLGEGGLLPGFAPRVIRLVKDELAHQGIATITGDARIKAGKVMVAQQVLEPDLIIAAIGSGAPDWPRMAGLAVDEAGYIAVDAYQRSTSHSHIFAAGDCAQRMDRHVPHSGVHAVHTGPVLAANLRALLHSGEVCKSYRPRPASLYLISTGRAQAVLSYGRFALKARWASVLKAWIDKGWIASYRQFSGDIS